MTKRGFFIINGIPRVIINQIIRRPGLYYQQTAQRLIKLNKVQINRHFYLDLISQRGAWLRLEIDKRKKIWARMKKAPSIPALILLQSIGINKKSIIEIIFEPEFSSSYIVSLRSQKLFKFLLDLISPSKKNNEILRETGKKYVCRRFLNARSYNLGIDGRRQLNKKLGLAISLTQTTLTPYDFLLAINSLIKLSQNKKSFSDIDHLENRRVRTTGELIQNQLSLGLIRLEKRLVDRVRKTKGSVKLQHLFTSRAVNSVFKEFFGSNPLSQFLDQANPLAELTHKRRLTSVGPGGVNRETAGMAIRGIHPSHYGKICPIETPEGQNAGLVNSPTSFSLINQLGFLNTPYFAIFKGQIQKKLGAFILDASFEKKYSIIFNTTKNSKLHFLPSLPFTTQIYQKFKKVRNQNIDFALVSGLQLISIATSLIPFIEHDDANRALMGSNMQRQAVPLLNPEAPIVGTGFESRILFYNGNFVQSKKGGLILYSSFNKLIFLKNLLKIKKFFFCSSYSQKNWFLNQAINLLQINIFNKFLYFKKYKLILTGLKNRKFYYSQNKFKWKINSFQPRIYHYKKKFLQFTKSKYYYNFECSKNNISLNNKVNYLIEFNIQLPNNKFNAVAPEGIFTKNFIFENYKRSNQGTCLIQKISHKSNQWVEEGDLLTNNFSSEKSEISLGKNIFVAYLPWEGYNFEDAILISDKLIYNDSYTSLHIEKFKIEIRETPFGYEKITYTIPDLENKKIAQLDLRGIVKIGTWVNEGDILVGRVTPIKPRNLLPHEKLLYDIVGKDGSSMRDTSLRAPRGVEGRIIDIQIIEKQTETHNIEIESVTIFILEYKKIKIGDKIAGRHGNKGIVSKILPIEDMPYAADGTPLDMVLNPLGVPSRMNIGQIFESLLGLVGSKLHEKFKILPFDEICGYDTSRSLTFFKLFQARKKLKQNWLFSPNYPGKLKIFDGRTGELFEYPVVCGISYMMKLIHLVDEKIHARSTGSYSLVTQQPLRGRSKHGGQRFGEMEVWALEGFGVAYTLQELLTVKSDDVKGRTQILETILKNSTLNFGTPESFKVLIRELQALCLNVQIYNRTISSYLN